MKTLVISGSIRSRKGFGKNVLSRLGEIGDLTEYAAHIDSFQEESGFSGFSDGSCEDEML